MVKYLSFPIFFFLLSCSNTPEQLDALLSSEEIKIETAKNIEIIYSDSAEIKIVIKGPTLKRHVDKKNPREEFPDGVLVSFYGNNYEIESWLDAKYAVRMEKDQKIIVRDSVVLYNRENNKLETSELIWDEKNEKIRTNKFVRITQPAKGDTSYGYGFESNQDFSKFEIKNFSAKMNADEISKALGRK